MIEEAMRSFRQCLCQINIYNAVARAIGVADSKSLMDLEKSTTKQIEEPLVSSEIYENTNLSYIGGTLDRREELTLKRLLFRATRGRAILNTFELEVNDEDKVHGDEWIQNHIGYLCMFQEVGPLRKIVERVCSSFNLTGEHVVIEISPKSVSQNLKDTLGHKSQLREVLHQTKANFYEYLEHY